MIRIYSSETGQVVGEISEEQLAFLREHLEEESDDDQDYYITEDTVELLEEAGADAALADVLRAAIGDSGGVDVRWSAE